MSASGTISAMSADDVGPLARLCAQELVLDRDAGSIPGILMRRPHIGLIATRDSAIAGACIASTGAGEDGGEAGFIDLLVVDRAEQRRGIGRELVGAMEQQLASHGCTRINLAGHGPYYAWPGIDIHYTAAICLAGDLGYQRHRSEVNMDVDLTDAAFLDTGAAEGRLRSAGIEVRRASSQDDGPLQESLRSTWSPSWVEEVSVALRGSEAGLHIAVQDRRYVGFCAYGVNLVHQVGPVGTSPDLRRLGIGEVLLKRCLADQRDRGLTAAELVWAGPLSYFARTLHATIGRAFWLYVKDLAAAGPVLDWRDRVGMI